MFNHITQAIVIFTGSATQTGGAEFFERRNGHAFSAACVAHPGIQTS